MGRRHLRLSKVAMVLAVCVASLLGCSESNQFATTPVFEEPPPPVFEEPAPQEPGTPEVEPLVVTSPIRFSSLDESTLIVCDYDSAAIILLDKQSLEVTGGFKVLGKPIGVVYSAGRYYVANRTNQSVDIFDDEGTYLSSFGSGTGTFQQINDLAHDAALSLIYVLDSKAALVRVFDYNGLEAASIGSDVLVHPTALTVDANSGEILVSDFGNHNDIGPQVFIFDSGGNVISPMSSATPVVSPMMGMGWGDPDPAPVEGFSGMFSSPQGLVVDFPTGAAGTRYLFLVDSRAGDVQGYNLTDGTQAVNLGGLGTEVGQLFYPLDVHVEPGTRDVFVADHRNGRVAVFREGGVIQ